MDNSTITINDLIILRNALDLASGRGAFRGAELSTVGTLFDKLSAFLAEVEAAAAAAETTEEAPAEEEEAAPAAKPAKGKKQATGA